MKILLVSGFLGAGKTTFIKEMAKNINLEFVVLENEYADIGVDGDFLDEKNLNVWEMSEGCICCSMKGDFKSSIKRIYSEINPEYLIIEPTGVGMLSSIIENIREINNNDIEILSPLTLIDITSFNEYLETFNNFFIAKASAIYPPVIEVVLVPPSAWITSQSMVISLSPNFSKSIEALKALPINLWISTVLPASFPLLASLGFLSFVALGNIEYSAVTQPFPVPLKNEGTLSVTEAVQITFVFPTSIKTEPSA